MNVSLDADTTLHAREHTLYLRGVGVRKPRFIAKTPGKLRRQLGQDRHSASADVSEREALSEETLLLPDLAQSISLTAEISGHSADVSVRRFLIGDRVAAAAIGIDGMMNQDLLEGLLRALMVDTQKIGLSARGPQAYERARESLLIVNEVREAYTLGETFGAMATGNVAIIIDGVAKALTCDTKGWQSRSVGEPGTETSVRGPREGFVENIRVNTSMLRRRIRTPSLWLEILEIGALTKTEVAVMYIKGLARDDLVAEVRKRLLRIQIDGILESGYIEELIEDDPYSLFPLVRRTERPDVAAAGLLEGRLVVITNGTPHVLVLPAELPMFFQAPDDYYEKYPIGTLIRTLRWFSALAAALLPGTYVAVVNFHQELLPTELFLRITATREGVPFPVAVEVFFMELLFEVLREAGIRLPATIGPAITIVGALVLGEAAIRAGMVSPLVVIIIALTAIASFSVPVFSMGIALRIVRFGLILLGAIFGLFGIQFGILLLLIRLCALRSFGVPYMSPLGPLIMQDMKDNIVRLWWWAQGSRPRLLGGREPSRHKMQRQRPPGPEGRNG